MLADLVVFPSWITETFSSFLVAVVAVIESFTSKHLIHLEYDLMQLFVLLLFAYIGSLSRPHQYQATFSINT